MYAHFEKKAPSQSSSYLQNSQKLNTLQLVQRLQFNLFIEQTSAERIFQQYFLLFSENPEMFARNCSPIHPRFQTTAHSSCNGCFRMVRFCLLNRIISHSRVCKDDTKVELDCGKSTTMRVYMVGMNWSHGDCFLWWENRRLNRIHTGKRENFAF